jgi:DNA invertase Pin-like site-specific DNA recombinase
MRAALYARVSTLNGQHPEMQLAELREYASRRGWKIMGEYVDEGVSGSKESRPELNRLMADAHRRQFDIVLVWKIDRFGRSLRHLVNALADLDSYGVAFASLKDNLDLSTPSGRLTFQIIAAMADYAEGAIMQSRSTEEAERPACQRCGTPHYPGANSEAISASGALNRPRRRPSGNTASTTSNFSDGSTRR